MMKKYERGNIMRKMKEVAAIVLSIAMVFGNITVAKAAVGVKQKESKMEKQVKVQSEDGDAEEDSKISFDEASLSTRIGCFKEYKFQGIAMKDISYAYFEYRDENGEEVYDNDIIDIDMNVDSDEHKAVYIINAKKPGDIEVRAFIELNDSDKEIATKWVKIHVDSQALNIVPLKSYEVYKGLLNDEYESVDENQDGQIDFEEIKNASKIELWYDNLQNDDLETIKGAVNCKELNLSGNSDITKTDVIKGFKKLEKVNLDDTGISERNKLNLLYMKPEKLKKGITTKIKIKPEGILKREDDDESTTDYAKYISAEDSNKMKLTIDEDNNIFVNATEKTNIIVKQNRITTKIPVDVDVNNDDYIDISDKGLLMCLLRFDENEDGCLTKEEMKNVTKIDTYVTGDKIDVAALKYATNLKTIRLNNCTKIINIDELQNLKDLKWYISMRDHSNLEDICKIPGLKEIGVSGVDQEDLKKISQVKNLEGLSVQGSFSNIDAIDSLRDLISLSVSSNQLKNIKGVENLTSLNTLYIKSDAIEDISPIGKIPKLARLDIKDCPKVVNIENLNRNNIIWSKMSVNIPAEQILKFEDYHDINLQKGAGMNLEADISFYDEGNFDPEHFNIMKFMHSYENKQDSQKGYRDITITIKGKDGQVSKKIHAKIQDADDIQPVTEKRKKEDLPTLSLGNGRHYDEFRNTVTQNNGNAYDVETGQKVADNAKSYVANYVYSDSNYFLLKTKISKDNKVYTAVGEKGELKQQFNNLDVAKAKLNYFLTKNAELYRIDEHNEIEKIADNVEDFKESDSSFKDVILLYKNGDITTFGSHKIWMHDVKKILTEDNFVLKDGSTIYYDWYDQKSYKIFDKELIYINHEYFMHEDTLYNNNYSSKVTKITNNVKKLISTSEQIFEGYDNKYYHFKWNDDSDCYEVKQVDYKIEDSSKSKGYTGVSENGTAYVNGNKILNDVEQMYLYADWDSRAKCLLTRSDGTVWQYEEPYAPKKIFDYNSGKIEDNQIDNNQKPNATTITSQNTTTEKKNEVKVVKIILSGISHQIAAGKKLKLTAKITNNATNKKLIWTTSNKKYATVSQNGIVTFNKKAKGKTVTITATAADGSKKKATYKVKIMKGAVKKITISGKKTVKAGKSIKLKVKVKASKGANKKLLWTSSNPKYAKVTSSGKVTASKNAKKKTVKIMAMATDGTNKKKTITVKIK